jgi:hypothetical protein
MAYTAPVLAPLLPSHRSHHHSIAAKTKAPDDDDVRDNKVGMVVIIVAASGTITLSLSTAVLPALSTIATPLPSHHHRQSNAAKTEVPNDE